jgi:hypothetical protein
LKGGGLSLVMQPLRTHQLAHEAEEYPAMNESTTGIDIVPLPTGQSPITESDALAIQKAVETAEGR